MRSKLVIASVLSVLICVASPPASATPTIQRRCSFTSITDPTVENGQTQTGEVNGGPVTDDTQAGASITITCTIQVGGANATHAGADAVACSGNGIGVAEVACQASYVSPEGQPVYLCTQVTVNGTNYYWDASAPGVDPNLPGNWSTTGGLCNEAISQEIFPGALAPVIGLVFSLAGNRTPVLETIEIEKTLLGSPTVVVSPDVESPRNWSCTPSVGNMSVSCTLHESPPSGSIWWCGANADPSDTLGPYVVATLDLAVGGYVQGTSSCRGEGASCISAWPVACNDQSPSVELTTFTCKVNTNILALQWHVKCTTWDP